MQAPPQDNPGNVQTALDAGDYLDAARRHRGWIFGFAFSALVVSVVSAFLWPDTFRSTASVRYRSSSSGPGFERNLDERVAAILSRTELKNIIDRFDLYPDDVKRLPIEDVIENMKRKIQIGKIERRDGGNLKVATFPVSFEYQDRFKAQKVVKELLARLMVQTPDITRAQIGTSRLQSAKNELEAARKDLESQETRIADFRTLNEGHLPDQAAADQETMSSLRMALAKVQNEIARATREQADLEASLRIQQEKRRNLKESIGVPENAKTINPKLADYDAQILAVEDQIKTLKTRYTENFPDVKLARQRLEKIRSDRDAVAREEADGISSAKKTADAEAARLESTFDGVFKRLQSQIDGKAAEIEKLNKEAADAGRRVHALEAKMQGSSEIEKQYADLVRERDHKKSHCDELEIDYAAQQTAMTAVADDRRSDGFEILDSPSLPIRPVEPNRGVLIGGGSVLGLLVGLVVAGAREVNERSIRSRFGLGNRPRENRSVVAARPANGRAWIGWTVAIVIGLSAMAVSVSHYYVTKV